MGGSSTCLLALQRVIFQVCGILEWMADLYQLFRTYASLWRLQEQAFGFEELYADAIDTSIWQWNENLQVQ